MPLASPRITLPCSLYPRPQPTSAKLAISINTHAPRKLRVWKVLLMVITSENLAGNVLKACMIQIEPECVASRSIRGVAPTAIPLFGQSVDFVMRADGEQQDRLRSLVLNDLENDPQVICSAARRAAGQIAFQFVRSQTRIKCIGFKPLKGITNCRDRLRL